MGLGGKTDSIGFRLSVHVAVTALLVGVLVGGGLLYLIWQDREDMLREHVRWMATGVSLLAQEHMVDMDAAKVEQVIKSIELTERDMYAGMNFDNMEYIEVLDSSGNSVATVEGGLEPDEVGSMVTLRRKIAATKDVYEWEKGFDSGCRLIGMAHPVVDNGVRIGTVNIGVCDEPVRNAMTGYIRTFGLLILATALGGVAAGRSLAAWVNRPVRNIAEGVRELAEGRLGSRVAEKGPAEVRSLAESFNTMAAKLEEKVAELTAAREEAVALSGKLAASYETARSSARSLETANREAGELAERLEGANRELSAKKQQTEIIVQSIRDAIVAVDVDENVILINPVAEELFQVVAADAVGRPVSELIDELSVRVDDPVSLIEHSRRSASSPETDDYSTFIVNTPYRRVYRRRSSAIRDGLGMVAGRVVTLRDITREHEMDAMKTNFVSTVSHELRTPLTSIKGSITLLKDAQLADEDTRNEFLNIAEYNTDRLISLITDLLDLSRMDSGEVRLNVTRLDIVSLVSYFVKKTPFLAGRQDVRLALDLPHVEADIVGDRVKMERMLSNLLSNAYKFSPEDGEVRLTVEADDENVLLRVEDQGPGIPQDKLERVFDRFYQVDMTATRKYGGTGLGLSICRAIVKEHGGRIWAESPIVGGRGARFSVRVPRAVRSPLGAGLNKQTPGGDAAKDKLNGHAARG